MRKSLLIESSLLAALGASLCCILPLITIGGVTLLGAAAAFEPWRPYLLAVAALLLVAAIFAAYRDHKRGCARAAGGVCAAQPNLLVLGLLAVVVLSLALFPYYSGSIVRAMAGPKANKETTGATFTTARFGIAGMTCPACARGLEASFRNMPGVKDAGVDYDTKQATVRFDPAKQNLQAVKTIVTDAGHSVTEISQGTRR